MEDAVPDPKVITIDALDPDTMALWRTVAKIAQTLGDHEVRWCLVGGLMVALFAIEAGQVQRPTTDIDILGDARQRPSGTMAVTERLRALGGEVREVSGMEHEKGFRFDLDGQIVDVLAPDGLAAPPVTRGRMQTIQIPGGSQALRRTEAVQILVEDQRAMLRRPTLVAAILLKARSLAVHTRPEDQRQDLIALLGLLTDPRRARGTMKKTEIRWLRSVEAKLNLGDTDLDATIDPGRLQIARAAYGRLIAT
jgi:hypothetical protein